MNVLVFLFTTLIFGKVKYMPGTIGSLLAFPFSYLILYHFQGISFIYVLGSITTILLILGVIFSSLYIDKSGKDDPKEIIIDEFVAQLLVILSIVPLFWTKNGFDITLDIVFGSYFNIFILFLSFVLFRFFDIKKPGKIGVIDNNIKGGLGVMLDDIVAAIYSSFVIYSLVFVDYLFYIFSI